MVNRARNYSPPLRDALQGRPLGGMTAQVHRIVADIGDAAGLAEVEAGGGGPWVIQLQLLCYVCL